jgi:nicotinamide riboside kinase
MLLKKIVIIGPESTGKSTLCELLAAHYKTQWVAEYAREYLNTNGSNYTFEDLYKIALGQLAGEDLAVSNLLSLGIVHPSSGNNMQELTDKKSASPKTATALFIDTDLYVLKVWSEVAFNKCDNRILTQIAMRPYDLYLLCNTDLPWVKDSLREYPDLKTRERLYHHYKDAMVQQKTNWIDISGNYEERFLKAVKEVDQLLSIECPTFSL